MADILPIALTGRETIYKAFQVRPPEEIDERRTAQWTEVAELVNHYCANEIETTWKTLSGKAYHVYTGQDLSKESEIVQLAWEAAARAMVNVATAEDSEDLKELGKHDWGQWIASKLGQTNGTASK